VLVDLGTEYAVAVGATREEVHVFSGEVQRTSKETSARHDPELLGAGEARAYGDISLVGGLANAEPAKFVREMPAEIMPDADPAEALLAYEGFDYADAAALRNETAEGGLGFVGPWGAGFARAVGEKEGDRIALNIEQGLSRDTAEVAASVVRLSASVCQIFSSAGGACSAGSRRAVLLQLPRAPRGTTARSTECRDHLAPGVERARARST
jgi:hypothetical protein